MSARGPSDRHSDLGPSSKDWQPGSAGRDEDFTPEKDLWTISRKGGVGAGRPGEDVHAESATSARRDAASGDIQPGTQREGRSWQSRRPEPGNEDDKLDQALKDTFPSSDPPQPAQPGITGWDLKDGERNPRGYRPRGRHLTRATPVASWSSAALLLVPLAVVALSLLTRSQRSRPRRRAASGSRRGPRRRAT